MMALWVISEAGYGSVKSAGLIKIASATTIMEQNHVMAGLLANGRDGYIDQLRCATVFSRNSQAANAAALELQASSQA